MLQIDRFCVNIIAECDPSPNRKFSPLSKSLIKESNAPTPTNTNPLPVSSFDSEALVKSLHYVRSLVSQHIPKRLFQPAGFAAAPLASRQALPQLSSLLSRSFSSQLSPAQSAESAENKDVTTLSLSNSSNIENLEGTNDFDYLSLDVLKWRWLGHQSSFFPAER